MAWDAKVEFIRNTNPFGSGDKTQKSAGQPYIPADETPEDKRKRIIAQMRARKARDQA